jgi:hypothetical protein
VCFRCFYSFVWKICHSKKIWCDHTCTCAQVFMYSTGYCCQIVMKLEIYRHILEKYWNFKLYEKAFLGRWVVPRGRTDRQTDMTKLIVAFHSFRKARKKETYFFLFPWQHRLRERATGYRWTYSTLPLVYYFGKVCLLQFMPTIFICKSAVEIIGLQFHSHNVQSNAATAPVCLLDWQPATLLQRTIKKFVRIVLTL